MIIGVPLVMVSTLCFTRTGWCQNWINNRIRGMGLGSPSDEPGVAVEFSEPLIDAEMQERRDAEQTHYTHSTMCYDPPMLIANAEGDTNDNPAKSVTDEDLKSLSTSNDDIKESPILITERENQF